MGKQLDEARRPVQQLEYLRFQKTSPFLHPAVILFLPPPQGAFFGCRRRLSEFASITPVPQYPFNLLYHIVLVRKQKRGQASKGFTAGYTLEPPDIDPPLIPLSLGDTFADTMPVDLPTTVDTFFQLILCGMD